MKEFLLPHYYKKIAISTGILGIVLWTIINSYPDFINIQPYILIWIAKMGILLSLLIFVFAKEKVESEYIAKLRTNNILVSFISGVVFLVLDTGIEIVYAGENFEMTSGYGLMMLIFLIYSVRFYIKKNIKTVVRA